MTQDIDGLPDCLNCETRRQFVESEERGGAVILVIGVSSTISFVGGFLIGMLVR